MHVGHLAEPTASARGRWCQTLSRSRPQGPANKYISLRDRSRECSKYLLHSLTVGREGGTRFLEPNLAFAYFDIISSFWIKKTCTHVYSYGVLLYSDGRMPPLVALFADLYQFCTRYVKSNNDLCSADVLTIARNTRQVNTSAEHRSLLLVSCPPFSTYGLGVRYICSLAPVLSPRRTPGLVCGGAAQWYRSVKVAKYNKYSSDTQINVVKVSLPHTIFWLLWFVKSKPCIRPLNAPVSLRNVPTCLRNVGYETSCIQATHHTKDTGHSPNSV